jgi:hypothetical protein
MTAKVIFFTVTVLLWLSAVHGAYDALFHFDAWVNPSFAE